MDNNSFFTIPTTSGNNGIIFKDYHRGLKRTNKKGSKLWIFTHKFCNASISTHEYSILKSWSIKWDGIHKSEHKPKMCLNVIWMH